VDLLSEWLATQETFPQCLGPRLLESFREGKASAMEGLVRFEKGSSFLAWSTGFFEQDTQEPIAALWGWDGERKAEFLSRSLRELDCSLMVELAAGDPDGALLKECGFVLERYRLSLTPREHALDTPQQGRYSLRLATDLDRALLCTLAADYAEFTLPAGQSHRLSQYTTSILARYREVDYGPDSAVDLFVAEEDHLAAGYILVELMDDGTLYLEDIGVKRSHWGKYVAQFLIRAAENIMVAHGIDLLWCEISSANRRSFVTAVRSLRFEPRVEIWMRRRL